MNKEVINIPISRIRVVNPRQRDKRKFALVVESISRCGLKKPIQVTERPSAPGEESCYDLVCGQGRKEAFEILGFPTIPAIVVQADRETGMLMSLVENMARRNSSPFDLVKEILRLKEAGYSNVVIAKKLDTGEATISGLITLNSAGEERLIHEAMTGHIPMGTAIDIARAESPEQQRQFLEAYEKGHLNQAAIRTIRRVLAQRNAFSKKLSGYPAANRRRTPEGIVDTLKKETNRQKSLVRKTRICEARLLFVVEAFRKLLADENFVTLLQAEGFATIPSELQERIKSATSKS